MMTGLPRVDGPLACYGAGFRDMLTGAGYTPRSAGDRVYVLAHLSRWLREEDLAGVDLTPSAVERFLLARRAAGYRRWLTARSLRPLLGYLRQVGAVLAAGPPGGDSPACRLLGEYHRYLVSERRLAPATVHWYEDVASRFLSACGSRSIGELARADVTGFVTSQGRRYGRGSMKAVASALRSWLRFLFVTGRTGSDLRSAVPAIAGWRMTALPRDVDPAVVAALLDSCDRATAVGLRDYAILMLMVRLGLRAGEVAALGLDDVSWRSGELVVRGKGGRIDRLPLPGDAGAALAGYLRHGRPRAACRALFLRSCAPAGPMTAHAVVMVPRCASRRAGIPEVGAHRLRHTAATQMLRAGASLAEVAQVLRHRAESSTALYAKVDRAALDLVVRPWPGAGQ
jgi:integrase/recombinase XerD